MNKNASAAMKLRARREILAAANPPPEESVRERLSGAVDAFEAQRGPVAAARIEMLGGHVGERTVAFGLRGEPAHALEVAADEATERITGREPDPDTEAPPGCRLAIEVVPMADIHRRQS
jgi:hypothetical protein